MAMNAITNAMQYDWPTWFLGIMRSFISGGSSSMVAAMGGMGIAPDRYNLNAGLGNTVKLMVVMFVFQGCYRMFEFLQLHSAPDKVVTTQETVSTMQPAGDGIKQVSTVTTTVEAQSATKPSETVVK